MKNRIILLLITTIILGTLMVALLAIENDGLFYKSDKSTDSDRVVSGLQTLEQNDTGIKETKLPLEVKLNKDQEQYLYEVLLTLLPSPSFDEELSKSIYDNLSERERELQSYTSKFVGYRQLSDEQLNALENVKTEEKNRHTDCLAFKEMEAIGEIDETSRITLEDVSQLKQITEEKNDFETYIKLISFIYHKQPFMDNGVIGNLNQDLYWDIRGEDKTWIKWDQLRKNIVFSDHGEKETIFQLEF